MRIIKHKILLLALINVCLGVCNAQSPQENLDKYWHYRYRLIDNFLSVGPKQGQSLPATVRNGGSANAVVTNHMQWVDASGRDLGWYIATLATEYYLLKYNGANSAQLNETVMELYYALHTVYRLDSIGIAFYDAIENPTTLVSWAKSPPSFPGAGYMYRDDVPSNFLSIGGLGYPISTGDLYLPSSPYGGNAETGDGVVGPVNVVNSDWTNMISKGNPNPEACDESIDNYSQLIMGLALVVKYVDPGISSFYDFNGTYEYINYPGNDLRGMAYQEGYAILNYIINTSTFCLEDPDGNLSVYGAAASYCIPLDDVANIFGISTTASNNCGIYKNSNWKNCTLCNNEALFLFSGTQIQNLELACVNAAFSNDGGPFGAGNGWQLISSLGNFTSAQSSSCLIAPLPQNDIGWDQCYGAILSVLYPGSIIIGDEVSPCTIKDMLDKAPYYGPFCHVSGKDYSPYYWASSRRFMSTQDAATSGDAGNVGNYNGLDYMLLFNLYNILTIQLTNNPPSPVIVPTLGYISDVYPYYDNNLNQTEGDFSDPITIQTGLCNEVLVNDLTVYSGCTGGPGWLSIKGTSQGILMKDTHIEYCTALQSGGYFHAYCPYTCCEAPTSTYSVEPMPANTYREIGDASSMIKYKMTGEFDSLVEGTSLKCCPNPCMEQTNLRFFLPDAEDISINLISREGKVLRKEINNELFSIGEHQITLDLSGLASGEYQCILYSNKLKEHCALIKVK